MELDLFTRAIKLYPNDIEIIGLSLQILSIAPLNSRDLIAKAIFSGV